jgi:hypothetical protein
MDCPFLKIRNIFNCFKGHGKRSFQQQPSVVGAAGRGHDAREQRRLARVRRHLLGRQAQHVPDGDGGPREEGRGGKRQNKFSERFSE